MLNYSYLAVVQIARVGPSLVPVIAYPEGFWILPSSILFNFFSLSGGLLALLCVPLLLLRRSISYIVIYMAWLLASALTFNLNETWSDNGLLLNVVIAQSTHVLAALFLWKSGQLKRHASPPDPAKVF